jgi:N-acetylglucosamine-6-phosphate deacetylase
MKKVYDVLGPNGFGSYEVSWNEGAPTFERISMPPQGLLIPGFVDIHIHGGFGIDFMTSAASELEVLCRRLEGEGYEGFLATTVTASSDAVLAAISNLPDEQMILGFHLEGPFVSPQYPGAQPPQFIVEPPVGKSEWDPVFDHPRLRLVTLAPEVPNALELVSRLMGRGVIVSMGHTNATFDETRRGFEFGASHATHTFNAMRPFHHREAGTVGYVLQNDAVLCELIYDRHHVSREAAALLLRCKGSDGIVAVSDGTMAAGMPPGTRFEMWGLKCEVGRGEVRLENGTLAGSAITLYDAFKNLFEDFGPEVAIKACCVNSRRALGMLDPPRVWLELNRDLEITGTFVRR